MHDRMNEFSNTQQNPASQSKTSNKTTKEPIGDYIDFEELK